MQPANQPTPRPLHDQTNSKPNKNKPNPTQLNKTQPYLPTPNGLSLCMTALPICPRPTMPTVLPLISGLQQHHIRGVLQCPGFLQASNNVFPIKKFQVQQKINLYPHIQRGLQADHFPALRAALPERQTLSKLLFIGAKYTNDIQDLDNNGQKKLTIIFGGPHLPEASLLWPRAG